ncbi:MAG: DUF4292 domain-containing protein [Desulfobacterales bacterium]|nr:DUF4292 domain-containing protein [Desulfobacterales bacterium]
MNADRFKYKEITDSILTEFKRFVYDNKRKKSAVISVDRWLNSYGFYTLKNIFKFSVLLIFSVSILTGCTSLRCSTSPIKPLSSPDDILKKVVIREEKIEDLKGIAKVRITSADKNYSLKEVIIVQKPSSLRMETLGFFGRPLFFLTAKDNRFSVLSLIENKFYQGKVTPEKLSTVFPLYLKSKDLFSILLGSTPLIDHADMDIGIVQEENLYLVRFSQQGGITRQFIWIEPLNFSIMKSEIYDSSENLILKVEFDNYKMVNSLLFPMSTSVSLPLRSTKIKIDYSELEINTGINRNSFDLDVPPGAKIVYLD